MYYYVYVLYSDKLNKKYIGFTSDIQKRILEHNSGKSHFTTKGIPWKLIYLQTFISKSDAMNEEIFLKTGKGRERLSLLLKKTIGRVA